MSAHRLDLLLLLLLLLLTLLVVVSMVQVVTLLAFHPHQLAKVVVELDRLDVAVGDVARVRARWLA